jgi:hypothetical protein
MDTEELIQATRLLISGTTGSTIDKSFVEKHKISTQCIMDHIPLTNVDGILNVHGPITHNVVLLLQIGDHTEHWSFGIAALEGHDFYLGYDWLWEHNPNINWISHSITFSNCPTSCGTQSLIENTIYCSMKSKPLSLSLQSFLPPKSNISIKLVISGNQNKEKKTWTELVPKEYHWFEDVFTKKEFNALSPYHTWDHAIELDNKYEPYINSKIYSLDSNRREKLKKFLKENLDIGQICPSKSPIVSSFFFIKKKDRSLQPVQDYWQLNTMTIPDRYPIPHIINIIIQTLYRLNMEFAISCNTSSHLQNISRDCIQWAHDLVPSISIYQNMIKTQVLEQVLQQCFGFATNEISLSLSLDFSWLLLMTCSLSVIFSLMAPFSEMEYWIWWWNILQLGHTITGISHLSSDSILAQSS